MGRCGARSGRGIGAGGDWSDQNGVVEQAEGQRFFLNGDGEVSGADVGLLLSLWGTSNPVCGDLDGDGDVRAADLGILLSNWDCR